MIQTSAKTWQRKLRLVVQTFVAGPLSRLGHDLTFEGEARVTYQGDTLTAELDVQGLRVVGASRGGEVTKLSDRDRRKIHGNLLGAGVLDASRYASIELCLAPAAEHSAGWGIEQCARNAVFDLAEAGLPLQVTLHGRSRTERLTTSGDAQTLRLSLCPSRYGIAPFRAMLGALQLEDRTVVVVHWPAEADGSAGAPLPPG